MPTDRAARPLPLLVLAGMLAVGIAVEQLAFGGVDWLPKLPLAALLAAALARRPPLRKGDGG